MRLARAQTKVAIDTYTLNFNPAHWSQPDVFDPLRFQASDDVNFYAYFRFGMGRRRCLGYRFADFITKLTLVTLLARYRVDVVGSAAPTQRRSGMGTIGVSRTGKEGGSRFRAVTVIVGSV